MDLLIILSYILAVALGAISAVLTVRHHFKKRKTIGEIYVGEELYLAIQDAETLDKLHTGDYVTLFVVRK